MKTSLLSYEEPNWRGQQSNFVRDPDLLLSFLSPNLKNRNATFNTLVETFPNANVVGCSTAGEVLGKNVYQDRAVAVAIKFDKTNMRVASRSDIAPENSYDIGESLARELVDDDLQGILIISDGLQINASQLVAGMLPIVADGCPICGGLAGDGPDFGETFVGLNGPMVSGKIVGIGFYGQSFHMRSGVGTGWNEFGPERIITRSSGNIVYELNNKPALDLYKRYLGEEADNLPMSGLLYPLKIYPHDNPQNSVIRTLIGIDEDEHALIFAGDAPTGSHAKLMVGNFDNLITGAGDSVRNLEPIDPQNSLSILISCVGRQLVLGQRSYEEAAEVQRFLNGTPQIGFYSYGEISPQFSNAASVLHNQSMTVAILEERL